jgi:hypothetical protein
VVRVAFALDMGQHIVGKGFDVGGTKECIGLGRNLVPDLLTIHVITFGGVVGASQGHAGAGPSAGHRLHDLLARQLGRAQRQRVTAISAAAIAVPFMAADAIGALEHGRGGPRKWSTAAWPPCVMYAQRAGIGGACERRQRKRDRGAD